MATPVFVGRERELAKLQTFWEQAVAGDGQVVFVSGEAGTGKTALLQEFAHRAQVTIVPPVIAVGTCNAYIGLGDPYLPFREILALLTGDVETKLAQGLITPENAQRLRSLFVRSIQVLVEVGPDLVNVFVPGSALVGKLAKTVLQKAGWLEKLEQLMRQGRPRAEMGEFAVEQNRLFEQYTTFLGQLAQEQPLVLVLDDLQWADAASISLLFHLGRRISAARILLIGAYRSDEVALGRGVERHPLDKVLAEFKRYFGDIELDLRQAMAAEGPQFVEALLDSQPNRLGVEFRRALFEQTEGHALFTVELLQAMQERGDLRQDKTGQWVAGPALDWQTLPARVEGVIEERIGRLAEDLRQMLAVASVEGENFTAQVVARVQEVRERQVLQALSQELEKRQRLVQEQGELQVGRQHLSRYRFVHGLFQHYLYHELSAGEQRLLHGEVGAALEELYQGQTDAILVQLAHHYAEAGETEKAAPYLLAAADRARQLYAHQEAIEYYHRVLHSLERRSLDARQSEWRLEALQGLGKTYFGMGKLAEAKAYFQQAIPLGKAVGLAVDALVRLYHWLGETLWWQQQYEEQIRIGEEGLALLGEETESFGAALMYQTIAMGYAYLGNEEKPQQLSERTAQFILRLPYAEELRPAYIHIAVTCRNHKRVEEARQWLQALEQQAHQHHDLRALAGVNLLVGSLLEDSGDFHGATPRRQQALALFTEIGDTKHMFSRLLEIGRHFLLLGDLGAAEGYGLKVREMAAHDEQIKYSPGLHMLMSTIAFCRGSRYREMDTFQKAVQRYRAGGLRRATRIYALGRAYLVQGERGEAQRQFQEVLALAKQAESAQWQALIAATLSGLEAAYNDVQVFQTYCQRIREEYHKREASLLAVPKTFVHWYLQPAQPNSVWSIATLGWKVDEGANRDLRIPNGEWSWHDPFGDCSFTAREGRGVELRAANGRDLWDINLSAPRLLRSVSDDFAAQTLCAPVSTAQPAIGGLLLWKDPQNYLRLDRGTRGEHEISFTGCIANRDLFVGRGYLVSEQAYLRLERLGQRVHALCSADGHAWWTVGI